MFGGISTKVKRFNKRCCCFFMSHFAVAVAVVVVVVLLFFSFAVGNSCLNFEVS